jgi:hypothetical protein
MSPLYLYNGQLLVKDNIALATNENCCCAECCGPQPAITIDFGPNATGGFAFPYGQVVVPFVGFQHNQPGCTSTWSTGNGLTITILSNNAGIIQSIVMVDARPGGHNTTWTHITGGITPSCLPCSNDEIDGTFDNWSNNPWNARVFGDWHEGVYGKVVDNTYLPITTVAPTLANNAIVNVGLYQACVGYRFKISGYHKYQNPNNLSDAEYQQAFAGQPAPWTGGPVNGAPAIVSSNPIAGPVIPNGLGDRVVTTWGGSTANHIYRATYVPVANIQLWAWINDSLYTDNLEIEPYYISAWQRFPRLMI